MILLLGNSWTQGLDVEREIMCVPLQSLAMVLDRSLVARYGVSEHYMVRDWWKLFRRMLTAMTSICRTIVQTKA